jgi:hypothetical protein
MIMLCTYVGFLYNVVFMDSCWFLDNVVSHGLMLFLDCVDVIVIVMTCC